ncbi:hypothetical protein HDU80_010254 [Chytriomyces hyalinus]|nr:hypothetical protein HDU80_010254 [Chytriomyces hyalinus]
MASLSAFLQTELPLFIAEAKRKHADIKDAAEALFALVKSLPSDRVAPELASRADSSKCFVLACATSNAKLASHSAVCLQRLAVAGAVHPSAIRSVVKAMADTVASPSADQNTQVKVLQAIPPILSAHSEIDGIVTDSMQLCFNLSETAKFPIVNSIAAATLRQIVLHVYEHIPLEEHGPTSVDDAAHVVDRATRDAVALFRDMAMLAAGEHGVFWRVAVVPKATCLELIESVLAAQWKLFKKNEQLLGILKDRVCPLLMRSFSDKTDFALNVRLMRLINVIVKQFHDVLVMECEIFLSLHVKLLESDHGNSWMRVLVVESIKVLASTEGFLRSIFLAYDAQTGSTKVFADLLGAVGRVLIVEKQAVLIIPREVLESPGATNAAAVIDVGKEQMSLSNSLMKVACLEQLEKTDAPAIPENYLTALCIQCIVTACETQVSHLLTRLQSAIPQSPSATIIPESPISPTLPTTNIQHQPIQQDELILALEMSTAAFPIILSTLTILLIGNTDADIYKSSLRSCISYTTLLGLLGLVQQRNILLETLCRMGTPADTPLSFDAAAAIREVAQFSPAAAQNLTTRFNHALHGVNRLGERNLSAVVAACQISMQLGSVLDVGSWYTVLETLQAVEGLHSMGRLDRRETMAPMASNVLLDGVKSLDTSGNSGGAVLGRKLSNSNPKLMIRGDGTGPSGLASVEVNLQLAAKNLFEFTRSMSAKSLKEFLTALCMLARDGADKAARTAVEKSLGTGSSNSSNTGSGSAEDKSFAVAKLHEVFVANNERIVDPPSEIFNLVTGCLIDIAHESQCTPGIRAQVCNVFGEVLVSSIQCSEVEEGHGIRNGQVVEMKLLAPLKQFMLVGVEDLVVAPVGVPVASVIEADQQRVVIVKGAWFVEVQKVGLETVKRILMSSGHNLVHGWFLIFEVLRSVVGGGKKGGTMHGSEALFAGTVDPAAASNAKVSNLVRTAFPSIQLVCGDFLGSLGPEILLECIETLGVFGAQQEDINISLTTIGLLWNISDNILMRRQKLEKEKKAGESPPTASFPALESTSNLNQSTAGSLAVIIPSRTAVASRENIQGPVTTKTMDMLWMHLLGHLSQLCSDLRPEVRNSANQTIFKTISINGKRLTLEAWDECIWNILFPLLERVKISSEQSEHFSHTSAAAGSVASTPISGTISASGIPINPNDSPAKFWNETKTLTLTGITNLLIQFFPVLIDLESSFEKAWTLFLDYIRSWALKGSPEVAAAAIKCFKLLVRYPKDVVNADGNPGKVALNVEARLHELWRVAWDVWEAIGLGIVAEANESGDDAAGKGRTNGGGSSAGAAVGMLKRSASGHGSQLIEVEKLRLLHGTFPQATLVQYANLFTDIHDVISSTFGLFELKRLLNVLSSLMLYHTNSAAGATPSKYRTDNILDLDNMSPYQEAAFTIITGTTPDLSLIPGASELILLSVSGFIRLPFVRLQTLSDDDLQSARLQPQTGGMEKGFTYMALAKRSIQTVVTLFEKHGSQASVYSGGIFESILACFDVPMRAKYDCPAPGLKDSTPLWRVAANSAMALVILGLRSLDALSRDLPNNILTGIYSQILDTFDGFLLPQSSPDASISSDELDVATDFDISIFETFETDVLLHLGQLHVSDALVKDHIQIICRASRLYKSHMSSLADISFSSQKGSMSALIDTKQSSIKRLAFNEPSSAFNTRATRNSVTSTTKTMGRMNLGTDVMPLGREKFSKVCLASLLKLCSDELNDLKDVRYRIATIAAPVVLDKMRDIIKSYASDRPLYGKLPLPRIRSEEILIVLSNLRDLQMRVGILHELVSEDKIRRSAHIFYLYPYLCDLLAAVAKAGRASGYDSPADCDEESVVDLVRECLARVGREMGVDN